MIFFSPTADQNDELSFLKNRVGLYGFSIDHDTTTSLLIRHHHHLLLPPIERYGYGPIPTNQYQDLSR